MTHALWGLEESGFRIWLKGGTSLSKGYGLIERFSEDLDLKLDHPDLPRVTRWTTRSRKATGLREQYFAALSRKLGIAGFDIDLLGNDRDWRSATFAARYESAAGDPLPAIMSPFIQLEVGSARVSPVTVKGATSWIHDFLGGSDQDGVFRNNRPTAVSFVSPNVTLLEKFEAITRRYARADFDAAGIVRHYEDALRIIEGGDPGVDDFVPLARQMINDGDIRELAAAEDPAFALAPDDPRSSALQSAWSDLAPMFWGERATLEACCDAARGFLAPLHERLKA